MIEVFMLKIKELYWNRVIKTRDISLHFLIFLREEIMEDYQSIARGVLEGKSGSEVTPV